MKPISCTEEEFIKLDKKVICFGVAEMAKEALENPDILEKVVFFIDNDFNKQNKSFSYGNYSFPVKSPEILKDIDWQSHIILITSSHFDSIGNQLESMPELDGGEYYIYPLLRLNYTPDSQAFFKQRILSLCLKEYEAVLNIQGVPQNEIKGLLEVKKAYIEGNGEKPFVIPRAMIMPTTRCNMRCKDCSSLLPYFDKPQDLNIDDIIRDLNIFFKGVDQCIRMTVGGEPFLYPKLKELLEYLLSQEKLLGILLITNSTLTPGQEVLELLKSPKIFVQISDYGHLEKMSKIVNLFENNGVRFRVITNQIWVDMGNTKNRNRTAGELRYTYLNCDQGRLVKSIHNGRFHTCGRSARMLALGSYASEKDYVLLEENDPPEIVREKLRRIYYSESADACNHCDCGSFPGRPIPAGIQLKGEFHKSAYTIVKREEYEKLLFLADLKEPEH